MIDEINFEETIRQNKLILHQSVFDKVTEWIANIGLIILLPILSVSHTITHLESLSTDLFGQIISNSLTIGFSLYVIFGIKQSVRLYTIKGSSLNENKERLKQIIQDNNWILYKEYENYFIIAPKSYKSQINIIFNKEDVIVNAITFGNANTISPFYQRRNSDYIETINEKFEKSTPKKS